MQLTIHVLFVLRPRTLAMAGDLLVPSKRLSAQRVRTVPRPQKMHLLIMSDPKPEGYRRAPTVGDRACIRLRWITLGSARVLVVIRTDAAVHLGKVLAGFDQ